MKPWWNYTPSAVASAWRKQCVCVRYWSSLNTNASLTSTSRSPRRVTTKYSHCLLFKMKYCNGKPASQFGNIFTSKEHSFRSKIWVNVSTQPGCLSQVY